MNFFKKHSPNYFTEKKLRLLYVIFLIFSTFILLVPSLRALNTLFNT